MTYNWSKASQGWNAPEFLPWLKAASEKVHSEPSFRQNCRKMFLQHSYRYLLYCAPRPARTSLGLIWRTTGRGAAFPSWACWAKCFPRLNSSLQASLDPIVTLMGKRFCVYSCPVGEREREFFIHKNGDEKNRA